MIAHRLTTLDNCGVKIEIVDRQIELSAGQTKQALSGVSALWESVWESLSATDYLGGLIIGVDSPTHCQFETGRELR